MDRRFHIVQERLLQLRQPSPRYVRSALIWAVHPWYCLQHEARHPSVSPNWVPVWSQAYFPGGSKDRYQRRLHHPAYPVAKQSS
eukprot:9468636-Pyramimonas_sp.AAC.1